MSYQQCIWEENGGTKPPLAFHSDQFFNCSKTEEKMLGRGVKPPSVLYIWWLDPTTFLCYIPLPNYIWLKNDKLAFCIILQPNWINTKRICTVLIDISSEFPGWMNNFSKKIPNSQMQIVIQPITNMIDNLCSLPFNALYTFDNCFLVLSNCSTIMYITFIHLALNVWCCLDWWIHNR